VNFLRNLVFPGGLVLAGAVALHVWAPREAVASLAPIARYVALAGGLLLAWNYNRSRAVALLLLLGATAWALPAMLAAESATGLRPQLLCVLVPLNVALFAVTRDRAVQAPASLVALGIVALQAVWVALLPLFHTARWSELLATVLSQPSWVKGLWMGQVGLLTFVGMLLALVAIFYRRRAPLERGMLWALAAAFVASLLAASGALADLYFAAAVLVVGIAVLEHAHALAYRDELTGLPSRRALNEFLPRLGSRFAVAMVDVDHFKQFNDTYGHDVGDDVLAMVASKLTRLEGTGRVYRYGGEEFIVVFPEVTKEQALPFLESLRVSIENTRFRVRGPERRRSQAGTRPDLRARGPERRARKSKRRAQSGVESVTVSIGLAEHTREWNTPEQVITAADKALYRAKQAGRNRVEGI
jgi:diguanylate cyclase (GGDEF)-like protein